MIITSSKKYLHCQFCCMELFIYEYTCKKACTKKEQNDWLFLCDDKKVRYEAANQISPSIIHD